MCLNIVPLQMGEQPHQVARADRYPVSRLEGGRVCCRTKIAQQRLYVLKADFHDASNISLCCWRGRDCSTGLRNRIFFGCTTGMQLWQDACLKQHLVAVGVQQAKVCQYRALEQLQQDQLDLYVVKARLV